MQETAANPKNDSNIKIFSFEDFSISDVDETKVGRKGLSLFRLVNMDVPVPDFFVISPSIFREYVNTVLSRRADALIGKGKNPEGSEISSALSRSDFDTELQKEILREYTKISGFTDSWVSVRSSVCFPQRPEVSFSGVFGTQLNVRGFDNLQKAIKHIYASMFNDGVIAYAVSEGIELADVTLGVVVQKMVQAEVSGVAFTVDPITQDPQRVSVEAVYGLGDVISKGEITPDTYILNKKDLSIIEKHIAPQEWMRVRTLGGRADAVEKIQISGTWSHKQKLEDKYITQVAKIGLVVEEKSGTAQDVEWVLGSGKVWVLQSKQAFDPARSAQVQVQAGHLNSVSDTLGEVVADIVNRGNTVRELDRKAVEEAKRAVEKDIAAVVVEPVESVKETPKSPAVNQLVLSGIGASLGEIEGVVNILRSSNMAVSKGDILVFSEFDSSMTQAVLASSGVIAEVGGITSDLAILCREFKIPAVLGVSGATAALSDGESVKINGSTGSVHRNWKMPVVDQGTVAAELEQKLVEQKVEAQAVEEVVEEKPKSEPMKDMPQFVKDSSLPRTATKVFVDSHNEIDGAIIDSDGIVFVDLDKLMVDDGRHPLAYLEDKKYKEYADRIAAKIEEISAVADPNEVFVSVGSHSVGEFRALTKGGSMEAEELADGARGVSRLLLSKKLLDLSLKIVRRVRNVNGARNVSLAIHSPMNGSNMRDIKKEVAGKGLRRTGTFSVFAVIENPAEVLLTDEILDAGVDGVVINTPALAKHMQGIPQDDKNSAYKLNAGSVLKVVETVISGARANEKRVIVVTEGERDLVKEVVQKGVYGITVTADQVKDMRKLVADQEAKIILGVK